MSYKNNLYTPVEFALLSDIQNLNIQTRPEFKLETLARVGTKLCRTMGGPPSSLKTPALCPVHIV